MRAVVTLLIAAALSTAACSPAPGIGETLTDTGTYPTTPATLPATAQSLPEAIKAEDARLAEYLIDPLDLDPALTDVRPTTGPVITSDQVVSYGPDMDDAVKPGLRTGFVLSRCANGSTSKCVTTHVLRFQDAAATAAAAAAAGAVTQQYSPQDRRAGYPPVTPLPVPANGIPDGAVAQGFGRVETQTYPPAVVSWITATLVVDTYLLIVYASRESPDTSAVRQLAADYLTRQTIMLRGYQPTPLDKIAAQDVPTDPDGVLRLAIPEDGGHISLNQAYKPAAWGHLVGDRARILDAMRAGGVTAVGAGRTTVYKAADDEGAHRLVKDLVAMDIGEYSAYPGPAGAPGTQCFKVRNETSKAVPRFACYVRHGRYVASMSDDQRADLFQQARAQYLILSHSGSGE